MFASMHYTLPFLAVMSSASIVYDENNQRAESNRYCKQMGTCAPGVHIFCRYGADVTKMGPRCGGGKPFDISRQKDHLLDLMNETRRKLAKNLIQGLPKAYGMRILVSNFFLYLLDWHPEIAYPKSYQIRGIIHFSYPEWIYNQTVVPEATRDKFGVEKFVQLLYETNKDKINKTVIENTTEETYNNPYLIMVHGHTTQVGCGASIFIDYFKQNYTIPEIYNVLLMICTFSDMPEINGKVYETTHATLESTSPCGCNLKAFEDDCLCGEDQIDTTEKNEPKEKGENGKEGSGSKENGDDEKKGGKEKGVDSTEKGDGEKGKEEKKKGADSKENGEKGEQKGSGSKQKGDNDKGKEDKEKGDSSSSRPGKCSPGDRNCKSPVVVMPIFAVENADSEKLEQIKQASKIPAISSLKARQQAISRFGVKKQRIRDRVQTVRNRYFGNAHDIELEPGTRFFGGGPVEGTFPLPLQPESILNKETSIQTYPTKNRPNIDIKPRKDFSNLEELVSEYLSYKHAQAMQTPAKYRPFNDIGPTTRKSYSLNGDDRNEYLYATNVNNRQSANIRKLRYGVPGFDNNNSPYIDNENDQNDQLSKDLYNLEQKSEDFAFDDIMNENSPIRNTDITRKYDDYLRPTMENGNPMDYSEPNDEENPNVAYYARTVQRRVTRPVTRYQNPLNTHRSTSHYYNDPAKSLSILMNLANENTPHTHVYGHSGFKTRSHENKNEFRKYLDTMKRIRPFKPLHGGFGDSSEYHQHHRDNYDEEPAEQHYYVPDRANIRHGY